MATTRSRTTDTTKRRTPAASTTRRTRKAPTAKAATPVSPDAIAQRAYAIFEAEGGGDHLGHWLRAERELAAA